MVGTVKRAAKAERLKLRGKVELRCEFNAGTRISFFWRPYVKNYRLHGGVRRGQKLSLVALMDMLREKAQQKAEREEARTVTREAPLPDALFLGAGLLHALNQGNSNLYAEDIKGLAQALKGFQRSLVAANHRLLVPPTFLNVNAVVPQLIKKPKMKRRYTEQRLKSYNYIAEKNLRLKHGMQIDVLDFYKITEASGMMGSACDKRRTGLNARTVCGDGLHYNHQTYDLALQAWLNTLVSEERRRSRKVTDLF